MSGSEAKIFDFEFNTLTGQPFDRETLKNKVVLIVNTASHCGYTPQYEGLEKLHAQYKDKGLVVLGFPCNDFGEQEPGDATEIGSFCQRNYGVSFTIAEKIHVKGSEQHPLFKYLTSHVRGILGTQAIKWNFTKFLVNKQGVAVKRFGSTTKPEELASDIESLLKQ